MRDEFFSEVEIIDIFTSNRLCGQIWCESIFTSQKKKNKKNKKEKKEKNREYKKIEEKKIVEENHNFLVWNSELIYVKKILMIGSFWNLCRACPSMPVDKVNVFINFLIATALCCYTDVWRGHPFLRKHSQWCSSNMVCQQPTPHKMHCSMEKIYPLHCIWLVFFLFFVRKNAGSL